MLRLKRWIAVFLTVCIGISSMPVYAFAAEPAAESQVITETIADIPANEETAPAAAQPTEAEPVAPSEQATETQAAETTPEETRPEETLPEETLPAETLSEETLPEETLPVETATDEAETLAADGDSPAVAAAETFKGTLRDAGLSEDLVGIDGGIVTLTVAGGNSQILKLLSDLEQTDECNYQRWNISFTSTGSLTLPDDFQGLGSNAFPFMGKFTGQKIALTSSRTIFNALDAKADLNGVQINWTGTQDKPILAKTLVADSTDRAINMPLTSATRFSPYIGTLTGGTGIVSLPTLNYSAVKAEETVQYSGDVGLVCGCMAAGTHLQVNALYLPESVPLVLSSTGNVGGLVGSMADGAELLLTQDVTLNAALTGQNAGGMVGSMTNALIRLDGHTATVSAELTAAKAAGGIVGAAVTQTGLVDANVVLQSVTANGIENSGVLYGTCTATEAFDPFAGVCFADGAVKSVSGPGNCGGVFGTLTLSGNGKCTLSSPSISAVLSSATNATSFGGVAGTLSGDARKNALVVEACEITSTIVVGTEPSNYPKYIGGIVAVQDTVTLDAKRSTISVIDPKTSSGDNRGFGGLSAYVGDGALLIADSMKVCTNNYELNPGGGGVAGSTHKGSIVYLKNSLDLSECPLSTNVYSGQIVGMQDCSLIYAPGVQITRLLSGTYNGMELDDIGNYGEIYRISDFLTVGGDYSVSFSATLVETAQEEYVLSTELDYACLALAWQSRGVFSTVDGIATDNWPDLKTCTIRLGADLNLTGCGIGGLTRDVYAADDTFAGVFDGGGYTIKLAIGEQNSVNPVSRGDGRIYWHDATGLFAGLSCGADVQKLTLTGDVRLSNNQCALSSGGLAAKLSCDSADGSPITAISTNVVYDVLCNGSRQLCLGGLLGQVTGTQRTTLNLGTGTNLAAQVKLSQSGNGSYNHIGGAIGMIDGNANVDMICDGAVVCGNITATGSPNNLYAGGLVGTILPGGNGKRTIRITNLVIDGFTLSGSASERMGGILGGIWANTDVAVDGLTVSKGTLTAGGTAALGGLVYRASGKWTVSSADLSDLSISASSAKALGLLVCHGGPYKEPVNNTTPNIDGLYLEMTEHWDWNADTAKGYQVPSDISFGSGVFDEFVAYTAYADRSSSSFSPQITSNGSGIISLKTSNGTVNMTGDAGGRNTYVNRTAVVQSMQGNLYSRYYYNLPAVMAACKGEEIDTAEELLIWSVYRYAASNLQQYFAIGNVTTDTLGGTSASSRASFDMKGLSYYPINLTNESVTVQYADITFYNAEIEVQESGNKLTRGDTDSHSQHYTMHCALFLNFTADLDQTKDYIPQTLTVNGVSFAGTVGVVNGGSGALLCGMVQGDTQSGNSSICTVVLADADNGDKAVSLNGLSVAPAGDYTPVLINKIGTYAGLKANYVTTTDQQTAVAGSSLIGNVGGEGANNVTVEFANTIHLPETGVFTKAILLNSLRYANGSATYRFYKSKDYSGDTFVHNATHGRELSTTVEYAGKQGCYYDGYGAPYYVSPSNNFDAQNDFNDYLPYVALSPATGDAEHTLSNGWHEIAVNVLSNYLTDGCGTYGHPYQVDANLFKEAANFINTGIPTDGWQVRIPIPDDSTYHTDVGSHDVLLKYTNNSWEEVPDAGTETLGEDTPAPRTYNTEYVRKHLQSAYYALKEDIPLSDFNGIGSDIKWAFTGVIEGNGKTVTLTGGSTAFVKYSYGCVIRDLNIVLDQSPTLSLNTWTRGYAEQAPNTFFGGVIGCVLGGDNIIDTVTVTTGENFSVAPSGTKAHLVPVGGYVGVIAGGGVIFRGNCSESTGITGTEAQLYQNPIIGRVLGGYAFYEDTGTAPDNGDKNYKINSLSGIPNLVWDGSTVTVNNGEGLLVLSAIVSSGAASTSSNAYTQGKARNAAYNHIGDATEPDDYAAARKDDGAVWSGGQTPYLLHEYADYTGSTGICSSSSTNGIAIRFEENAVFSMDTYGNGYRGLSARYVSNAAFSTNDGGVSLNVPNVIMRVSSFDGQNATVQNISMDIKEYADDDFHAASVGGIFNIVWTAKQSGGTADSVFAKDLTLQNCNVQLKYIDSSGDEQNEASIDTFSNEDGRRAVSVGGFIGMANDIGADGSSQRTLKHNYLFSNIHIKGSGGNQCQIYGPNAVGGLIGATAMASSAVTGYPGKLLANGTWALFGPSFLNCSYSNIEVSGGLAAGGLVGDAYANGSSNVPNFSGLGLAYSSGAFSPFTSCTVTDEDLVVGQNAKITARAKGSIAGGLFGGAGMRVGINDPDVNTKSGIAIIEDASAIRKLKLSKVQILVSQENYNADGSNPDNGPNYAYAAGIIGRIGNVNPSCFYDICISNGSVTSTLATASYVGGLQGSGYTNSTIAVQRCEISDFEISGTNAGGLLGSGKTATGFSLSVLDCKLEDCTISGDTCAGGLVGEAASRYNLSNVLLKNTSIEGGKTGRLFGLMNFSNPFYVYAAGISVYADKESVTIPERDGYNDGNSYNGYIAYADYLGTETEVDDANAPYVTVNPYYALTGADKLLTGDAVGTISEDTYGSVAARIWADQKGATEKKNLASYFRVGDIVNGNNEPTVSTFYAEQGCGPVDLPVLVPQSTDAKEIENYLDVITNGGYSEADSSNVTLSVSVYYWDKDTDKFYKADAAKLKSEPVSIYVQNDKLYIRSTSFDNTRNRFTLVEATFTATVNGEKCTYTVSVPVIIKRQLQFNFISTFSYGAEFQAETFDQLKNHVLESTGNPFTAYVTYEYNRDGDKDTYVEYDWQSYMDGGGSMLDVDKILHFSSGLPAGTQMILVDRQNGGLAYQYTTAGSTTYDVYLSSFTSVSDPETHFRASMAEILGVACTQDGNGGYVVETDQSKATVRLKDGKGGYVYYRPLANDDATSSQRYTLTVPDLSKVIPEESYYVVITVPKQETEDFYINGRLTSDLNWTMPSSCTWIHRYDRTSTNIGNNDETTYQISAGYQQKLESTAVSDGQPINLVDAEKKMQVQVKDTITFSNKQAYDSNDKLYLKFTTTLQQHLADSPDPTEIQFPAGTAGTVRFYIQDAAGQYFTLSDGTWRRQAEEAEAASYLWTSKGADMELPLSADGTTLLDLSGIRQLIMGAERDGSSQIIVTAQMDIDFSNIDVVPGSDSGTDRWAQLHYVGQISTQEFSLDYSSARVSAVDNATYYRSVKYAAILSMDAASINQLGINPLQLVPSYLQTRSGKQASVIDLTAALNLANLQDIEDALAGTKSITFTLSLLRRSGDTYVAVSNPSDYISFDTPNGSQWSWTIPQAEYYQDGKLNTNDIFDGSQFTIPLKAYVFTDQKDYANYQIKLTVEFEKFEDSGSSSVPITDSDAYVVYTFACIKPTFYDPTPTG